METNISVAKESRVVSTVVCTVPTVIICTLLAVSLLLTATVISILYSDGLDNYKHNTAANCTVIGTWISNKTCAYRCNCYRCGKSTCCDECHYMCYVGHWNVLVNNIHSHINTGSFKTYSGALKALQSRTNSTTYHCFSNDGDLYDLSWNEDEYPKSYYIAMIILWTFFGATTITICIAAILFVIGITTPFEKIATKWKKAGKSAADAGKEVPSNV
jgi:hypothetical protein